MAVEPHKGLTAHLQCDFKGAPSTIEWYKNENILLEGDDYTITLISIMELEHVTSMCSHIYIYVLLPGTADTARMMWARHVRKDEGVIESHFSILAVGSLDYAAYSCHGKNSLGENQAIIKLIGEFHYACSYLWIANHCILSIIPTSYTASPLKGIFCHNLCCIGS